MYIIYKGMKYTYSVPASTCIPLLDIWLHVGDIEQRGI